MVYVYIKRFAWFIGLVLLQVLVLNYIHIAGYATPFLYIYFILKLDTGVSRNELMLWGFFLGLCVDIFSTGNECCRYCFIGFCKAVHLSFVFPA